MVALLSLCPIYRSANSHLKVMMGTWRTVVSNNQLEKGRFVLVGFFLW